MDPSLMSMRTALILLIALLVGIGAAVLTTLAGAALAQAILAGFASFGVALPLFNNLIERT